MPFFGSDLIARQGILHYGYALKYDQRLVAVVSINRANGRLLMHSISFTRVKPSLYCILCFSKNSITGKMLQYTRV